jgi:hypothetical protein
VRFNPEEYITVAERIALFYAKFPEGRIVTEMIPLDTEASAVVMKAFVYRKADDAEPAATGHACEAKGGNGANQTSHIENAETSAVGRAIVNLGFEVKRQPQPRQPAQRVEQPPKKSKLTPEEKRAKSIDRIRELRQQAVDLNVPGLSTFDLKGALDRMSDDELTELGLRLSEACRQHADKLAEKQ